MTFGIPSLALPLPGWCPYAVEGGRCLSHLVALFLDRVVVGDLRVHEDGRDFGSVMADFVGGGRQVSF